MNTMQTVNSKMFNENAEHDLCIYESDFKIKIKRNADAARLYFTEKNDTKITVPFNIDVNSKYSNRQYPINDEYVLCWLDPYTIILNNKTLLNISSEKSFIITPTF